MIYVPRFREEVGCKKGETRWDEKRSGEKSLVETETETETRQESIRVHPTYKVCSYSKEAVKAGT